MNYANAEMVGPTGVIEAVDVCMCCMLEATLASGGDLLITADNSNIGQLFEYYIGTP